MKTEGGEASTASHVGRLVRLRHAAWPIALAYLYRALGGAAVVEPAARRFSELVAHVPGGDRDILRDGGLLLLEVIWRSTPRFDAWLRHAAIAGVAVVAFGLAPLACVVVGVASKQPIGARALLSKAAAILPTFSILFGLASLAEVILSIAAAQIASSFAPPADTPVHAATAALIAAVLFIPIGLATLLQDVARVAAVVRGVRFYDSASRAIVVLRRRVVAIAAARISAGIVSLGLIGVGAATPFVVGLSSGARWFLVALVQQIVVALLVVVRALYFARLVEIEETA